MNNDDLKFINMTPPKWLLFIFKIYGGIGLISGIFGIYGAIFTTILFFNESLKSRIGILLDFNLLGIYGVIIIAFLLGYGSWYLKRWVIPLFLISFINSLFQMIIFTTEFQLNILQKLIFLIPIILFFFAYRYRQYFTGSYKNYRVYIFFVLAIIFMFIDSLF